MKIIVLGAAGSIGSAVVWAARAKGHEVRAALRSVPAAGELPVGTELLRLDLLDGDAVRSACQGMDAVVHAANIPYPEWSEKALPLAENALRAAEAAGAILALPGNVYVYGHPRTTPVTEDHPHVPHTEKGQIRLEIERRYLQADHDGRIRLILPRYPDFYGPRVVNSLITPIFDNALTGKPCRWPLNVDAPHEFILIDDAAEAMLVLIASPGAAGRPVHVPGPGSISARGFAQLAYDAAGKPLKIRSFGRGSWRLVGWFSPMVRSAFEMSYLFDEPVLLGGDRYRSVTGAAPPATPYSEGVRRTLEWVRAHPRTR